MSKDTIYREDAIEAIHREARIVGGSVAIEYADMFQDAIKALPSADRPQGEWKPFDRAWGREIWYCTACEASTHMPTEMGKPMYDYCPYCGADMREREGE